MHSNFSYSPTTQLQRYTLPKTVESTKQLSRSLSNLNKVRDSAAGWLGCGSLQNESERGRWKLLLVCTLSGSSRGSTGPPRAGLQLWRRLKLLDENLESYERGMLCSLLTALELNGSRALSVGRRGLSHYVSRRRR